MFTITSTTPFKSEYITTIDEHGRVVDFERYGEGDWKRYYGDSLEDEYEASEALEIAYKQFKQKEVL